MSIFKKLSTDSAKLSVQNTVPRIRTWFTSNAAGKNVGLRQALRGVVGARELDKFRQDIVNVLNQITAELDLIRADGTLTFKEVVSFCVRLFQLTFPILQSVAITATQRKDYALAIADEFYTRVVAPLDIPYVPTFVENSFLDPLIGKVWHEAASGLYDALLQFIPASE